MQLFFVASHEIADMIGHPTSHYPLIVPVISSGSSLLLVGGALMSSGRSMEVWKANREAQERYDYFLMALCVAAIGFSVQRTTGLHPDKVMLWLLGAVLCWAVSLLAGFWRQTAVDIALRHDYTLSTTNMTSEWREKFNNALDEQSDWAVRWRQVQTYGFLLGAVLFIVWHFFEMLKT